MTIEFMIWMAWQTCSSDDKKALYIKKHTICQLQRNLNVTLLK